MENPITMGWFGDTPIFGNTQYEPKKVTYYKTLAKASSSVTFYQLKKPPKTNGMSTPKKGLFQ